MARLHFFGIPKIQINSNGRRKVKSQIKAKQLIGEVERSTAWIAPLKVLRIFVDLTFGIKKRVKTVPDSFKKINTWAPKDSVELRFFSNYQIGNTHIFLEDYDSAAFYLNRAFEIDIQNDLGKYEGSVQDRAALILYLLEDYEHSLQLSEPSLRQPAG